MQDILSLNLTLVNVNLVDYQMLTKYEAGSPMNVLTLVVNSGLQCS